MTPIPRLAQYADIPRLAQLLFGLKSHTGWSSVVNPDWSVDSLIRYVSQKLVDPASVVYVCSDSSDVVTGFCGVTLGRLPWPPYSATAGEWGWGGNKREAAVCWQAARRWAKKQHVQYMYRVSGKPGRSRTRVQELVTWEVL